MLHTASVLAGRILSFFFWDKGYSVPVWPDASR